jgi:catechol 2,3-dioxygenase-like lactoylglutathione lyase family enzyme
MPAGRLITVIVEVSDLAASLIFYRDCLGLPLHTGSDNGAVSDRWISGDHAATSWSAGAYLHFSLYQSKGEVTRSAQIAFDTEDLEGDHRRLEAAGVSIEHGPRPEPWGATARYRDPDGNTVSLTQR